MKVKVIAREVHYDHRGRLRGEEFEADDRWARGKIITRQVEKVPDRGPVRKVATTQRPEPAPVVAAEAAPEVEVADVEVTEAPEVSDEAFSVPARYRTRRLKAED
jgi:hypothetical protein